jgi:hypothetical protein
MGLLGSKPVFSAERDGAIELFSVPGEFGSLHKRLQRLSFSYASLLDESGEARVVQEDIPYTKPFPETTASGSLAQGTHEDRCNACDGDGDGDGDVLACFTLDNITDITLEQLQSASMALDKCFEVMPEESEWERNEDGEVTFASADHEEADAIEENFSVPSSRRESSSRRRSSIGLRLASLPQVRVHEQLQGSRD